MKSEQLRNVTLPESITLLLQFSESEIRTKRTPSGLLVELQGCHYPAEPGAPAIPIKVARVALPSGAFDAHVEAKAIRTIPLASEPVLIAPVQPPRPLAETSRVGIKKSSLRQKEPAFVRPFAARPFAPPVPALYAAAAERPLARLVAVEELASSPVAVIEIAPVQIDPKGRIEFVTDIELNVKFHLANGAEPAEPRFTRTFQSRAQAERVTTLARSLVLNPEQIIDFTPYLPQLATSVDYLIITDNSAWDSTAVQPKAPHGDLAKIFGRLADWKRSRGLGAKLVTVSQIVNGVFGDFVTGSRDLQEIIRNFLKWAHQSWGVAWVLLGGDVDTIPVRQVAAGALGNIGVQATNPPADNCSYWTGAYLKMHVVNPGDWWPGDYAHHRLTRYDTGKLIPYDPAGTSSSTACGWYYTTNDTYTVRSATPTQYVRVNGPAADINGTMHWVYDWNWIPTDLYYGSLQGPAYSLPGKHDWDLLDNGIYGQHTDSADFDGMAWAADVSVGRAPVSNEAQANAFVNKVMAYEQFRRPDGSPLDTAWPRRMLLVSTDFWEQQYFIQPATIDPAPIGQYFHGQGSNRTVVHLEAVPSKLDWNLIAQITSEDFRLMPFTISAASAGRGWYFAKSSSDLSPNIMTILNITIPLPSQWIVVYGTSQELAPQQFILDDGQEDDSMVSEEQLRLQMQADVPQVDSIMRLYEDEVDLPAGGPPVEHLTEQRLRAALNDGQHFVSLAGHGSGGGCCWLGSGMAQTLQNGYHTSIAYAYSCLTNQFDMEDSMSEYLVQNPNGGAVAYVGNTRFGWGGTGSEFQKAFFHRLTLTRHLGLLNDGRCALAGTSAGCINKWSVFSQNLLGDPEMPVWLASPAKLNAHFTQSLDKRNTLVITVTTPVSGSPQETPVPLAAVHIRQGNFERLGYTNPITGMAYFDINPAALGNLEITATKLGFIPYIGMARIAGPAWVSGTVTYIEHRRFGTDTYVRLHLDTGIDNDVDRGWFIRRTDTDFDVLLDAVTDAYVSAKPVSLFVNLLDDGATAERFLFGVWMELVTGFVDFKHRLAAAPAQQVVEEVAAEKAAANKA